MLAGPVWWSCTAGTSGICDGLCVPKLAGQHMRGQQETLQVIYKGE